MATARYGYAAENGNQIDDEYRVPKRRSTKYSTCPTMPHHGFVFKTFTRDSLRPKYRKKSLANKKLSTGTQPDESAKPQLEPDPYLASGQQLPPALVRQFPNELLGKPIEDIDPYYADQQTFVIISRGKEITRFSATKALYFFGPFHPIRRVVLYILVNPLFNLLVILTILTNCILMTVESSETIEKTEVIFTIVYTTEMGLKVLARGFIVDHFTYLRDPWNWLDFAVIVMAYLTIVIQDLGNLSVIRTFRVLRALKTVAIIPGMKTIVGAVIDSVKNLKDVVVLTLFSLSVFSLVGLQIYMGQLTQKCILNGSTNMTDAEWFVWCNNSSHWVPEPDDEIFGAYRLCGNATGAQSCPDQHTCLQGFGPNPDYGYTNFDTFGWALICSFRLMTQDFWEGLYMQILKTAGSWHIIFFIISIFLGSIYLMNLILAIVAMSYNELQRSAEEEEEAAAEDEAAFLESCRLMEQQEQFSDYSNSTMTGRTSYRPSVEIGLVGQSLLASLCQNGLLGQHVRNKLNQQLLFPSLAANSNARSHSLSVGGAVELSSTGQATCAHLKSGAPMKRSSVAAALGYHYDPPITASSMTELRRKSSVRTLNSGANSPTRQQPLNRSLFVQNPAKSPGTSLAAAGFTSGTKQQRSSPLHHVSSSVLMTRRRQSIDSRDGVGAAHQRSSITSDRDLSELKQRAALIKIGDSLARKEPDSIDFSETSCFKEQMTSEERDYDRLSLITSGSSRRYPVRRSSSSARTRRLLDTAKSQSDQKKLQQRLHPMRLSVDLRHKTRTKSHDYSLNQTSETDEQHKIQENPFTRFRSEVAICEQPKSIQMDTSLGRDYTIQAKRMSIYSNTSDQSYSIESSGDDNKISGQAQATCLLPVIKDDDNEQLARRSVLGARSAQLGGSTRVLMSYLGNGEGAMNLGAIKRLAIERHLRPEDMTHLSVENFQQFGLGRQQHSGASNLRHPTGFDRERLQAASSQNNLVNLQPQQESLNESVPVHSDSEQQTHGAYKQRAGRRGRLDSRSSYIHPATMMRSSFARPRESVIGSQVSGNAIGPTRRISQDFVRRASNWSRLSMSGNVDLRRLLRLWSHTNPYQNRASITSFSNYSQANQSALGSPVNSLRDFQLGSQDNSPRPSSVGSNRQAYELISASHRRRQRFLDSERRYSAIPLDDNMIDRMSVNMRDKCLAYCLSCLDVVCIWECCGAWLKLQRIIALVVFDPFAELFIIFCILINTLFMALDSDDADAQMKSIFERGNYFFTATFAVEASMKIMALSPKFYFREGWNVFDSIIVGLSLLELGLEGVYGLSVLRSFRLLRVFKLAKSWPTLNLLISIMGKAVGDLGNLTFVLAIIVFIFAVMGMQLFGTKYVAHNFPSGELPRWNFTDFMHSFMIVFRILCAEWIEPMWDCLLVGGWPCIPFFLIAVTVGNLVVLNLFLALLLASFGASNLSSPQADNVDTKKLQEAIGRFSRFARWTRKKIGNLFGCLAACLLGRKRQQAGLTATHRDGAKKQGVNSHIVAMSRLERLKNIEQRTEELKSKIRRSPEHHYHLRQLAQSQLKESTCRSSSAGGHGGYNFNYQSKQQRYLQSASSPALLGKPGGAAQIPRIPIIVNEAAEGDDEEPEEANKRIMFGREHYGAENSPIIRVSGVSLDEIGEINENQTSIAELCNLKQQQPQCDSPNLSESITATTNKESFPSKPSARHPNYFVNMQPIREDSRDADSSNSLSEIDIGRPLPSSLSEQASSCVNRSLDRLAHDEVSLASSRWKLSSQAQVDDARGRLSSKEKVQEDEDRLDERLLESQVAAYPNPSRSLEVGGITRAVSGQIVAVEVSGDGADDQENNRPKSSLYLKAPRRLDMEDEDEEALQHIETYIEKCIFVGIICLKWFLFRQYVRRIVEHRYFDQCILILIVISSGTLALEDKHLNERPTLKRTLDVLDTIFTIIFSLEMIFKWLAFGMKRYFGNIWSWLDFVIVLVSFINLMASIFGSGKIQALKTMRTLRAMRGLRPLRALQRFQGMRVVVNALIQAIPSIFNVLLVCLIFWLIFSIMGVQMFGGKFWRCLSPETHKVVSYDEAANRQECLERNLTWANPQINFDNVLNAYLALFQVATFKGWIDIMNSATDSRGRNDQPMRESNIYMYFYFVFFVIFGSFFTLNLFIGVIIDNFNEQKKKTGGSLEIFMTDDQKKYYHAMKKMRSKRPIKAITRPKLKLQAYMFDITTSRKFDMAIMLIIGLNMFVMALEHYGQSQEFSMILENLNLIFIAIFTLECLCKIFAMRHFYFREPWNIFDFIVVDLSILGVVMKEYVAKYFVSPTLLRVVRVVKVGRVLRLVKGAKGIRTLLFALAMSLPALFNICLLLFLVMFIYAIFGMSFFMNVRPRSGIDETFNFETFSSSIIVLFQMSTSAGWDLVLDPLMDEENDCQKPDPALGIEGTCGNKGIAIFYLITYVIVTFLIIINMYIAVILENYSQATEDVQEGLTDDDYEMYYEIWQKFDPNGTQYLPYEKLSDFVDALEDPLRIAKPNGLALVVLDINIYEGNQCYCVDILDALTKYFFTRKGLVIQVNEHLQKVQSTLHETPFERITTTYMVKRQHYCARIIQNSWRRWRDRTRSLNQRHFSDGDASGSGQPMDSIKHSPKS